jgi:hypothetical protein
LAIPALVLGALLLLGGCGARYEALKSVARTSAENVADEALDYAVWFKCRGATAGAVQRRYAGRFEIWATECLQYQPSPM